MSPATDTNTTEVWRDRFPGVRGTWARFDGAAGTQAVDDAIEAMRDAQRSGDLANDHGFFPATDASAKVVADARAAVAELLGGKPDEIVFNTSSTANILTLTRGLARQWSAGDEIVLTRLDHEANVAPWLLAAEEAGAVVRWAEVDPASGHLDAEQFADLVSEHTRWVAVTAASNAIGTAPEIARITEIAHAKGARVLVDAVAFAPHRRVDVAAMGCDVLVTSPYKWYGPHSGAMWMAPDLIETVPVYQVRGAHTEGPSRFELGTAPFEELAGITAAARFLLEIGLDEIRRLEDERFATLLSGLLELDHVAVHGEPSVSEGRLPTVAFTVDGVSPEFVARYLALQEIAVYSGDFYAIELIEAMGLKESGGVVRASLSLYTTADDVERLLAAIRDIPR